MSPDPSPRVGHVDILAADQTSARFFAARYQLHHKSRYLIWLSADEADGVYIDARGHIPIFRSQAELNDYAHAHRIDLVAEEPILHNFDIVRKDLKRKRPVQINCRAMLAAWNLFGDMANSLDVEFDVDEELTCDVYSRLFWGSNIPAITPCGEHFTPRWRRREHRIMRNVLNRGFALFTSAASPAPAARPALKTNTPSRGPSTD